MKKKKVKPKKANTDDDNDDVNDVGIDEIRGSAVKKGRQICTPRTLQMIVRVALADTTRVKQINVVKITMMMMMMMSIMSRQCQTHFSREPYLLF